MWLKIKAWRKRRKRRMYPASTRHRDNQRAEQCRKWNDFVRLRRDVDESQESAAEWLERNRHLL